jgi:hypothetical protein
MGLVQAEVQQLRKKLADTEAKNARTVHDVSSGILPGEARS